MPPNKYDFGKMSLKLEGNCKRGGPGHGYRKWTAKIRIRILYSLLSNLSRICHFYNYRLKRTLNSTYKIIFPKAWICVVYELPA